MRGVINNVGRRRCSHRGSFQRFKNVLEATLMNSIVAKLLFGLLDLFLF